MSETQENSTHLAQSQDQSQEQSQDQSHAQASRPAHWLLACTSQELKSDKALSVILHDKRYVLFRSQDTVTALDDICPHRFARLSQGTVIDGVIACPYHGLRFNKAGKCTAVPSGLDGQALPKATMPVYPSFEAEGFVWIYSETDSTPSKPHYWPAMENGYDDLLVVTDFNSTPELLIENFVDCSHTNFVHAGDFRSAPENIVHAEITEKSTGVLIKTTGEKKQDSLLSKLLIGSQADIEHTDELILPHTVRVDYRFKKQHFVTVSVSQALTAQTTRVYTRLYFLKSWKSPMLKMVLRNITHKLLAQDKLIVEPQAENIRTHGAKPSITVAADAPGIRVRRAYRAYYEGTWNGQAQLGVDYKL